jgi:hypothetical protein
MAMNDAQILGGFRAWCQEVLEYNPRPATPRLWLRYNAPKQEGRFRELWEALVRGLRGSPLV